jgi:DNA-binding transcriptional LysR family regulator
LLLEEDKPLAYHSTNALIECIFINDMHLSKIDLNLFVVFDTIYAEGGITRAGKRLHLSQPAMSHALGRLRNMFGDPLFVRRGPNMVPTPFARQIIEAVRQSLQGLEVTLTRIDRFDPATASKRFTVGMRDVLESAILPALMRNISRTALQIDLSAVRVDRRDLEGELAAGSIDAALDILLPLSEDIRRHRIGSELLTVLVRQEHPAIGDGLGLDTYLGLEHIAVSSRRRGLTVEDFELGRHNLRRRIRLRSQHYFAACATVSETDLALTMPERYARILNAQFKNKLLPFPLNVPAYDTCLYWHANAEGDPANAWLRRQLLAALSPSHQ